MNVLQNVAISVSPLRGRIGVQTTGRKRSARKAITMIANADTSAFYVVAS